MEERVPPCQCVGAHPITLPLPLPLPLSVWALHPKDAGRARPCMPGPALRYITDPNPNSDRV